MRYLIYGLLFISSTSFSQTFPVPVAILDSMIFEIAKGRACDSLQRSQANELHRQGLELLETNKALKLSQTFGMAKESEIAELKQVIIKGESLHKIDLRIQKKKSRRLGFIAGLSVFVVVEGVKLLH